MTHYSWKGGWILNPAKYKKHIYHHYNICEKNLIIDEVQDHFYFDCLFIVVSYSNLTVQLTTNDYIGKHYNILCITTLIYVAALLNTNDYIEKLYSILCVTYLFKLFLYWITIELDLSPCHYIINQLKFKMTFYYQQGYITTMAICPQ